MRRAPHRQAEGLPTLAVRGWSPPGTESGEAPGRERICAGPEPSGHAISGRPDDQVSAGNPGPHRGGGGLRRPDPRRMDARGDPDGPGGGPQAHGAGGRVIVSGNGGWRPRPATVAVIEAARPVIGEAEAGGLRLTLRAVFYGLVAPGRDPEHAPGVQEPVRDPGPGAVGRAAPVPVPGRPGAAHRRGRDMDGPGRRPGRRGGALPDGLVGGRGPRRGGAGRKARSASSARSPPRPRCTRHKVSARRGVAPNGPSRPRATVNRQARPRGVRSLAPPRVARRIGSPLRCPALDNPFSAMEASGGFAGPPAECNGLATMARRG